MTHALPTPQIAEGGTATVAVMFPGDTTSAATWSGIPRGVVSGLVDNGIAVQALNAAPSGSLHSLIRDANATRYLPRARGQSMRQSLQLSRRLSRNSPFMSRTYSHVARRKSREARGNDGVVQIGTGYRSWAAAPLVTYEDMTIAQAVAAGYPEWQLLSTRALNKRVELQKAVYQEAHRCCLTTHWAAHSVIHDYGISAEKVHVVGVGQNHTVEPPPDRDWSTPHFLFVGWDWERKNGPAVLRAFSRLRHKFPQAQLDVVGRHPTIIAPGVRDHGILRLTHPGNRRQMEFLYRNATCFVMPSLCEPSALAYVEAAAAGLPSIGTIVGGSSDLIGNGGVVIDPNDEDALFAAMVDFSDPSRAAAAGTTARERSHLFTWHAVASRLLRALDIPGLDHSQLDDFL